MVLGENLIDLRAKEHFVEEIQRKQREIDDLRISIDMNYKKIISDGILVGILDGDLLIEGIENILNKNKYMNEEYIDVKIIQIYQTYEVTPLEAVHQAYDSLNSQQINDWDEFESRVISEGMYTQKKFDELTNE